MATEAKTDGSSSNRAANGSAAPGAGHPLLQSILLLVAGIGIAALLVFMYPRIETFGDAAMYAASWVTFLHVCVGEFVLVRYLHARAGIQIGIDALAFVFLAAGCASFTSTALWCALFGAVLALAVIKYMLVEGSVDVTELRQYAREKVRWESPAVIGLTVIAVAVDRLPPRSAAERILEIGILCATTGFAVWMIGFRHAYRRVKQRMQASTKAEKKTNGGKPGAH